MVLVKWQYQISSAKVERFEKSKKNFACSACSSEPAQSGRTGNTMPHLNQTGLGDIRSWEKPRPRLTKSRPCQPWPVFRQIHSSISLFANADCKNPESFFAFIRLWLSSFLHFFSYLFLHGLVVAVVVGVGVVVGLVLVGLGLGAVVVVVVVNAEAAVVVAVGLQWSSLQNEEVSFEAAKFSLRGRTFILITLLLMIAASFERKCIRFCSCRNSNIRAYTKYDNASWRVHFYSRPFKLRQFKFAIPCAKIESFCFGGMEELS